MARRPGRASAHSNVVALRRTRPMPPPHLMRDGPPEFIPDAGLREWAVTTFIAEGSTLENGEHAHLQGAEIGFLWTNVPNSRARRSVVGQAELMPPQANRGAWAKAAREIQIRGWFGSIPDFIITLDAPYCDQADDASFCALLEHELCHCGQAYQDGMPKFHKDGTPAFAMRGHDVEEFETVVRRYGAAAAGVADFVEAGTEEPLVGRALLDSICGTCLRRAA